MMPIPAGTYAISQVGEALPPNDKHAVSVSMPTWAASLDWAHRKPEMLERMQTGYPRFHIHPMIEDLSGRILTKMGPTYGPESVRRRIDGATDAVAPNVMLFVSLCYAKRCAWELNRHIDRSRKDEIMILSAGLSSSHMCEEGSTQELVDWNSLEHHAVIYPSDLSQFAKAFWTHTGFGISSRHAEVCLQNFDRLRYNPYDPFLQKFITAPSIPSSEMLEMTSVFFDLDKDIQCKDTLRRRISSYYGGAATDDVLLYGTGMTAMTKITEGVKSLSKAKREACQVVVYGFPYVDTFKTISVILQTNTTLYGHASASELDALEFELERGSRVHAIFLEFPGNPLLRTPDIKRIRELADKYDFALICDDTVGTAANIDTLSFADVACTSLTKLFSGACNVMGGSLVFNSSTSHGQALRRVTSQTYTDDYFPPNASIMELNSRDFPARVHKASFNAELIYELLAQDRFVVEQVFYPKDSPSQSFYDAYKLPGAGYGYLLSIKFKIPKQAVAFFDALNVAKGPSLGTNFTLACPYTLFAHYREREWAARFGVGEFLVRISIGLEDHAVLSAVIRSALEVAREA